MYLRLVILPPPKIAKFAGNLAKQITSLRDAHFAVDDKRLAPHITLGYWKLANSPKAHYEELKNFAKKSKSFPLEILGISKKNATLVLAVERSRKLLELRLAAHEIFAQKPEKVYWPHITLAKFKNTAEAEEVLHLQRLRKKTFLVQKIAICTSDKFGQIRKKGKQFRILKEFLFR